MQINMHDCVGSNVNNRRVYIYTEKQIDRHIERQSNRQTDRQADILMDESPTGGQRNGYMALMN